MQPHEGGQYNDVLANNTCLVDVVKRLFYMIFGWWSFGLIFIKPNLSYIFQIKYFYLEKGFKRGTWVNPP
jgi:hypothetical protein